MSEEPKLRPVEAVRKEINDMIVEHALPWLGQGVDPLDAIIQADRRAVAELVREEIKSIMLQSDYCNQMPWAEVKAIDMDKLLEP